MNIAKSPARSLTVRRTRRYITHMLRHATISCGRRITHGLSPSTAMNGIIRYVSSAFMPLPHAVRYTGLLYPAVSMPCAHQRPRLVPRERLILVQAYRDKPVEVHAREHAHREYEPESARRTLRRARKALYFSAKFSSIDYSGQLKLYRNYTPCAAPMQYLQV